MWSAARAFPEDVTYWDAHKDPESETFNFCRSRQDVGLYVKERKDQQEPANKKAKRLSFHERGKNEVSEKDLEPTEEPMRWEEVEVRSHWATEDGQRGMKLTSLHEKASIQR